MSATTLIQRKKTLVTVQRRTLSRDAGGSPVTAWATHLANVPMFMQPRSGSENVRYSREANQPFVAFYCAANLDIQEKDRLLVGSKTFDIQVVTKPGNIGGGALSHLRIEAQEVRL